MPENPANPAHHLPPQEGIHLLGLDDGKKRFADNALAMSEAFTLCCDLDEAKAVREELAFLQAIKALLIMRGRHARIRISSRTLA